MKRDKVKDSDKGEVWFVEEWGQLNRRRRKYSILHILINLPLMAALILIVYLFYQNQEDLMFVFMLLPVMIIAILANMFSFKLFIGIYSMRPYRVYSKGVEITTIDGKEGRKFIPYEKFKSVSQERRLLQGTTLVFTPTSTKVKNVLVYDPSGKVVKHIDEIKKRIGKKTKDVDVDDVPKKTKKDEDKSNKPQKPVKGMGKLLFTEDKKYFQRRKKVLVVLPFPFFFIGIILTPIGGWILKNYHENSFLFMIGIGVFLFGIALFIFGIASVVHLFRMEPLKFYENGVLKSVLFEMKSSFYPYGKYEIYSEAENELGKHYILYPKPRNMVEATAFYADNKGAEEYKDIIFSRIGNPDYEDIPGIEK